MVNGSFAITPAISQWPDIESLPAEGDAHPAIAGPDPLRFPPAARKDLAEAHGKERRQREFRRLRKHVAQRIGAPVAIPVRVRRGANAK